MNKSEEIISLINRMIAHQRKSTISNHFKTFWERNENQYSGSVEADIFLIWRYSKGLNGIHPVIKGNVNGSTNSTVVRIETRLNPFGYVQLLAIVPLLALLFGLTIPSSSFDTYFAYVITLLALILIPCIILVVVSRYEARHIVEEIIDLIESEIKDEIFFEVTFK